MRWYCMYCMRWHPLRSFWLPGNWVPSALPCRLVDEVVWVKMTVNRRLAKSHGYYLQHAKEVRLLGRCWGWGWGWGGCC
jgi:hypothetical protein